MSTPSELLRGLEGTGADPDRGGYSRHAYDDAELALREWFRAEAHARGLQLDVDGNGGMWAWWGEPGPDAVVTGSHMDSVPGGGAFDGPLGVVSGLAAVDALRAEGFRPRRPLAVVVFAEEEGGRFGVPCLGSRLSTGAIEPERAAGLRDVHGVSLAEAMRRAGLDARGMGPDPARIETIGQFVELHVEQGSCGGEGGLAARGAPVGLAGAMLPHGRWRVELRGQGNHAGATPIGTRHDPMLPAAELVRAAREVARDSGDTRATVGRLAVNPGGSNVIADRVRLWLDVRADTAERTRTVVERILDEGRSAATGEGCELLLDEESFSPAVGFDAQLRHRLNRVLGGVPVLDSGAGHDAGVLAADVPTAMLFVRNPTGISHAPEEYVEQEDCEAGADALRQVLRELAG